MRIVTLVCLAAMLAAGCGDNKGKVEMPTDTVGAPKAAVGVGAGSGKDGGLPKPPDSLPK
jgi:hypothetical protein